MKDNNTPQRFTLDELITTLGKSLDKANQQIMSGEAETPFSISEFSVDLEVHSHSGKNAEEKTVYFSFLGEEELRDPHLRASSRISIRLKPTLLVTHGTN